MLICFLFISFSTSFLSSPDFNYNTDGYEGEGAEDGKSQDGSETLPYIDESPTMSPLCAPQGPDGEAVSPTPPEGLPPGVRAAHTHAVGLADINQQWSNTWTSAHIRQFFITNRSNLGATKQHKSPGECWRLRWHCGTDWPTSPWQEGVKIHSIYLVKKVFVLPMMTNVIFFSICRTFPHLNAVIIFHSCSLVWSCYFVPLLKHVHCQVSITFGHYLLAVGFRVFTLDLPASDVRSWHC